MPGPLAGVRVVEIASIGPGPFTAMLLADMGADVIRLERPGDGGLGSGSWNLTNRGRPSVGVDLKSPEGVALTLDLCERAQILVEGFRPGVMERLGLGPAAVLARNPRLVYGRMTGYGQDGPLAHVAGHDINYISVAGALGQIARRGERPLPPLNLLGDYGGGAMLLAFGVVCALLEARQSGEGQVVDASMVEGTALLTTLLHAMRGAGLWNDEAGTNWLDSGAHWYGVYETADGRYVSVGALEPRFYARLLELLGLDPADHPQYDTARWPELTERFAEVFRARTQAQWAELLQGEEACATPVLGFADAPLHPHNVARGVFVEHGGAVQPAPAPRFSRTEPQLGLPPRAAGADTDAALAAWGVDAADRARLREAGAIG